jgi:hypothetical protein
MILVDTSIWIDHLGKPDQRLIELLENGEVCCHPHVIGELALGNLRQYDLIIRYLSNLLQPSLASDAEVISMIRDRQLQGSGLGFSDAHLIASVLLTPQTAIWTRDRRLNAVALRLGVAWAH